MDRFFHHKGTKFTKGSEQPTPDRRLPEDFVIFVALCEVLRSSTTQTGGREGEDCKDWEQAIDCCFTRWPGASAAPTFRDGGMSPTTVPDARRPDWYPKRRMLRMESSPFLHLWFRR